MMMMMMMMMNFIHVSMYLADANWGHKAASRLARTAVLFYLLLWLLLLLLFLLFQRGDVSLIHKCVIFWYYVYIL